MLGLGFGFKFLSLRGLSMQAKVKTQNEITIVSLLGRVDVETAEMFRAACMRELKGKRIVFDFAGLSFVGSQGILPFLEALQAFYEQANFKFSAVGLEFRKVFSATPLSVVEIYDNAEIAALSFYMPTKVEIVPQPVLAASPAAEYIAYRSTPPETDDELDV